MRLSKYKNFYEKNGFVIIKNLINKNTLKDVINEIEVLKIKVKNLKNKKYYHKTHKGKFNSIHNIQEFIKKGKIINITKNLKLKKIVQTLLKKNLN